MKPRRKLLLAALLVALFLPHVAGICFAGKAQTGAAKQRVADPIQSIRRQYAAINKRVGRYRKVKKQLSGFSLEGGGLVAYFDGPAIVKIVATHYGESGRSFEEYYYANDKLIFVFRKEFRYDKPMSGKVVNTSENRFYFWNDRLIQWLNNQGDPTPNGIADYKQKQAEYLESSRKFLNGARSNASTIEARNRSRRNISIL